MDIKTFVDSPLPLEKKNVLKIEKNQTYIKNGVFLT